MSVLWRLDDLRSVGASPAIARGAEPTKG